MNASYCDVLSLAKELMALHGLVDWTVQFSNAKRYHGRCWSSKKLIELSRRDVLTKDARFVKDTILHEIAHAICPVSGHGREWREIAYRIGVRDPIYRRYNLSAKMRTAPKPTDFAKKLAHAETRIKQLTTRRKRIETAIKKWQRRVRIYTTRISKTPLSPNLPTEAELNLAEDQGS